MARRYTANQFARQMMGGSTNRSNTQNQGHRVFHAAIDGRQAGPFTITEMSKLVKQNTITRETLVWKQGMPSWQQAQHTPEIMVFFPKGAALPTMPSSAMPPPPAMQNMPPPPPPAARQTWEHYSLPIEGVLNECTLSDEDHSEEIRTQSDLIKGILAEFKIDAEITGIIRGPVVTMYEILPAPGIKLSKITELENNIALRLAAKSLRILSPIPGKNAVGIEVPNKKRDLVSFRKTIEDCLTEPTQKALPVYLGKTITGEILTVDLATMPHLLVAGTTGSGKSVCINAIILSLLYRLTPAQCRMIFIDPKIVELKLYDGIPHLLTPVITDPEPTLKALRYCVNEMERRYEVLGKATSRNIKSYNNNAEEKGYAPLPYWVIIIDEFADLMAVSGKETEALIARLAAKSRAIGIHLIMATQRPSSNVITGIIKANIPARIAFMVASNNDSRIILDSSGAEKLLGRGDMLYTGSDTPFPLRAQGAYVCEDEAEKAANHLRSIGKPEYVNIP